MILEVQNRSSMSVNLQVKGMLAKCLAMENIIIEHRKVRTASFDVDKRVLTLPMWERASSTVYDLLCGHEVGHSLFTDNIDWKKEYPKVSKDVVNILEDVRVERLMKKKYPGLCRTFYNGYNELNNDDFFSTKDENLDELNFIDRINLYFKIGAFHNISFTDEENDFLTRAAQTETFDDVLKLSSELTEFVKSKKQKKSPPISLSNKDMSGGGTNAELEINPESESGEDSEDNSLSSKEEVFDSNSSSSSSSKSSSLEDKEEDFEEDELESKTSKSFDEKTKELFDENAQEIFYAELPKMNLENCVIPNEFIHKKIKDHYSRETSWIRDCYNEGCRDYNLYKNTAQREVSYLIKEFECKKSADRYSRSTVSRTGSLDMTKLHTYKFNEDIFKKVSVIPDGKNHGLIFIFDWSGSIQNFILDAYKQLLNLIWFCRRTNIPFEVYAFTTNACSYVELQPNHPPIYDKVPGVMAPGESFRLMNLFTSKTNNIVLGEQLKNIWVVCRAFQRKSGSVPPELGLSGSPIGESIIALHSLIPHFREKNKIQKVNVIFLTDGEGYQNPVTYERKISDGTTFIAHRYYPRTVIRDRKNGRVYQSLDSNNFQQYAKILLQTVKDKYSDVNIINFRITPSSDFKSCYRWYGNDYANYPKIREEYRKNGCVQFNNTGFDQFNVLASNSLSQNTEFTVPENATKAQIKSNFSKVLGKRKNNKKLLGSFVDLIA